VFAGVGERTREGNDLYREMIESGVIKLGDKQVNIMWFMIYMFDILPLFSHFTSLLTVLFHEFRVRANVLLCTVK